MKTKAIRALSIGALFSVFAGLGHAQEIDMRLSVKYILDVGGNRPAGYYATEANIYDVIEQTNTALERWGRGYRYVVSEIVEVSAGPQFFDIADDAEFELLESTAELNPTAYAWRSWATNVYIVNSSFTGGAAAIPSQEPGEELVILIADPSPQDTIWVHELGHHNDLLHTFDPDDFVDDTRPDPDPFMCQVAFQCSLGGNQECCCSSKIAQLDFAALAQGWTQQEYDDIRWNVMSYYGATDCTPPFTFANIRLSEGQLDRWTDATRLYHPGEVSGLTYFVDGANPAAPFDGLSSSPIATVTGGVLASQASNPAGGDIVLIRAGGYAENLTIGHPVTLRSSRGVVAIGGP